MALGAVVLTVMMVGCASSKPTDTVAGRISLKHRALECLRTATTYPPNPAVRLGAVEALESSGCQEVLPWIRSAFPDPHPGVRFAACMSLGRLRDSVVETHLLERLEDGDPSVQVAAIYALHRLGVHRYTGRLPTYLLQHEDVTVRRNAALALGLLGESSAIAPLARAMKDRDVGVRNNVLEALARLGNREARQELTFMANTGVGSEEVFALGALAATGDAAYLDTFRYKLATAAHLETRLAAAEGLGRHGLDDGYDLALYALRIDRPIHNDPKDSPAGQILRVKLLAAAALGAIGQRDALPSLEKLMDQAQDPRVQVSAAGAILEILKVQRRRGLPFEVGAGN